MAVNIDPEGIETGVVHRLVDFRGKDVLEIGCGDGRLTRRYAQQAASVLACDPDEAMIAAAQESLPEAMRRIVCFRVADVRTIELEDAAYDVAFFSGSL